MVRKGLQRKEVPQEHSHESVLRAVRTSLQANNPAGIVDPVFALLGDAAAANGGGGVTPECLQTLVSDQAFSNAKAIGDIDGMTAALVFRALERNTASVGGVSKPCTAIKAKNEAIAKISQHQDAASPNAAAVNKAITVELAKQIAAIGGDPLVALKSGTFAPGQIGDPTAKGNTCDDANDAVGCIFTQKLLVEDATEDEIRAAVAGVAVNGGKNESNACQSTVFVTVTASFPSKTANTQATAPAAVVTAATPVASPVVAAGGAGVDSIAAAGKLSANIDLGKCPHIAMGFAKGIEGRKETAFIPAVNNCGLKNGDAGHIACLAAKASVANGSKDGSTADMWNAAFGIATSFRNVQVFDNQGRPVGNAGASANNGGGAAQNSGNTSGNGSQANSSQNTGNGKANSNGNISNGANAGSNGAAASGGNLQKFSGALGGVTAPAVTAGGRGFVVAGNADFVNLSAALSRSCAVQHNANSDIQNAQDPHYIALRNQAIQEGNLMHQAFDGASRAHQAGDGARAKQLSTQGHTHQQRKDDLNRQAADFIFNANNRSQPPGSIDLHGLFVQEAIERTERAVQTAQSQGLSQLRVITGKGIHSQNHVAKIKPAIEQLMVK
ncbi:hypothetical protein EMMF5_005235 [Cystobasidiomycetes sp. EMM_F5]